MTSTLDDLYAALPDLACRSLCEASCHSRIDASDAEHQRLLDRRVDLPTTADGRPCPALTRTFGTGRCTVHQLRPMVCRVWGLAKALPCPHGCRPDGGLVDDTTLLGWLLDSLELGGGHQDLTRTLRPLVQTCAQNPTAAATPARILRGARDPPRPPSSSIASPALPARPAPAAHRTTTPSAGPVRSSTTHLGRTAPVSPRTPTAPRLSTSPAGRTRAKAPDDAWTTFLTQLHAWANQHGHARVPQAETIDTPTGPYPLGIRVKIHRAARKQGALSPEQIADLDAVPGWAWDSLDSRWNDRCHQVAEHARTHGDLQGLPSALYQWLRRQRTNNDLTDSQHAQLAAIPGALDTDPLAEFLTAAQSWLDQHPDRPISAVKFRDTITLPDGTTYPLGRRITYFRRRTTGQEGTHPLPAPDVQRLEQLRGWTTPSEPPARAAAPKAAAPAPAPRAAGRPGTTTRTPKYQPLADHLRARPGQRTTLTFERIADMIRGGLPAIAYTRRSWWGNETGGRHVHARAWTDTGWHVSSINLDRRTVTFVRHPSSPAPGTGS